MNEKEMQDLIVNVRDKLSWWAVCLKSARITKADFAKLQTVVQPLYDAAKVIKLMLVLLIVFVLAKLIQNETLDSPLYLIIIFIVTSIISTLDSFNKEETVKGWLFLIFSILLFINAVMIV